METQNLKEDARDIINHAGDYMDTFYKLNLIRATKKASNIASGLVNSILLFFTFFCIILFASVAAAWWLGDVFESPALGFLSVASFYLVIALILILMRKKVISPFIKNALIKNYMKRKITSYEDLEREERLLEELLEAQKQLVQADIEQLKSQLKPASMALKLFNNVTTVDRRNPLLNEGANTAIDFLLKNLILAKSGWITKMIIPYLVKNYSSHLIGDNRDGIMQKLFSLIGGKNGKAEAA